MPSPALMSGALSANIQILQDANARFGVAQRRVSTGKWVFNAADDTTRYRMSEALLGRARQIESINNTISLGLKTLEATNSSLNQMISLVESAQTLLRKAQSESIPRLLSTNSSQIATADTPMAFYTAGANTVLSITSDSGQNFRYVFNRTGVTYGEVANALNAANIGVIAEFVPTGTSGQPKMRLSSTNGLGFRFDGVSDEAMMRNFQGLIAPNSQFLNTPAIIANHFGLAGATLATETGFTVAFGGQVIGSKLNPSAFTPSGSSLVFKDGFGAVRTYSASTAATNAAAMAAEFTSQFRSSGVIAEVAQGAGNVTGTAFRIRNSLGGGMELINGTGDFATGSANLGLTVPQTGQPTAGYPAPDAMRYIGHQYDAIKAQIDVLAQNTPVAQGRNLLNGQNMAIVMDEFAGSPLFVTGLAITSGGTLGMALAGSAFDETNLQTAFTQTNTALSVLRDMQGRFATFVSYMKGRYDANAAYSATMKTEGDELVGADMAEESANMTSLQTRQQFAVQAFSMGSQNMQGLLRLMG